MAIYVGENKALMLKSDHSIAKLFKGDNVIFDYDAIAEGEIVTIDNAHSVKHKLGVNVKSRNLFDADTVLPSLIPSITGSNWYWTKQEDGSFMAGNVGLLHRCVWFENTNGYEGQIALSITHKSPKITESQSGLSLSIYYTDGTSDNIQCYGTQDYITQTLITNPNKTVFQVRQSYNYGTAVFIKDIMIAYGTDTTYTPYMTDFSSVNVTRCGKNLFDGSIKKEGLTLSGTGNNRTVVYNNGSDGHKIIKVKPNTTYYFSGDFSAAKDKTMRFASFTEYPTENSVSNKFGHTGASPKFTTTANDNYLFVWATVAQKTTDIAMQIEKGTTATEFEQYNGQTVTANADGTVEGLTSTSPNMTLFTDADGVVINCEYVKG